MERVTKIFNGRFTIESPRGGHKTFQIKTAKAGKLKGCRIVSLLIGSDNLRDYKGFAFATDEGIKVWRNYKGQPGAPSKHEKMVMVLWSLATEGQDSPYYSMGYRLLVEGTCIRCNRTLTHPESIRSGIGPECAGRWR